MSDEYVFGDVVEYFGSTWFIVCIHERYCDPVGVIAFIDYTVLPLAGYASGDWIGDIRVRAGACVRLNPSAGLGVDTV